MVCVFPLYVVEAVAGTVVTTLFAPPLAYVKVVVLVTRSVAHVTAEVAGAFVTTLPSL
jgi:hypothetical protein